MLTLLAQYACNSAQMSDKGIKLFCAYGTLYTIAEFGQTYSKNNISCKNDGENFKFNPSTCAYSSTGFGYDN